MRILISLVLGLLLGSFANVYFYRVPKGLSIFLPRSFCPHCQTPIHWFDNIPLFSYLILRRMCRHCQNPIDFRYPMVETLSALFLVLTALKFSAAPLIVWISFLIFTFTLFLIAGTDLITYFQSGNEYGIIPDSLVLFLAISGLLSSFVNPFLQSRIGLSLLGGLGGASLLYCIRLLGNKFFGRESIGLGDVKMIGSIGFWLGWGGVLQTLIVSSLVGTAVSLTLIYRGKLSRSSSVPYGPFLAVASFSALFF
ncbi:MAG: prepilin peptidase [Elusimicrobia bacterium]|nr:prepilin peptidase [Elusimicrobiota bacterium]MBI4218387.1 prepilin peptidase [Elusimicrobiota bacterium]